uniref:Uncharacterized protein n=1 Tax=Sorangium cellulosum TaxID=56 RepID=A0A3S5GYA7_SORCE|nr:hypothetical protein [Sorangium cellulosum]
MPRGRRGPDPAASVMVDRAPLGAEMPMIRYELSQVVPWPGRLERVRRARSAACRRSWAGGGGGRAGLTAPGGRAPLHPRGALAASGHAVVCRPARPHLRDLLTRGGAAAAFVGAGLHLRVAREPVTAPGAELADARARGGDLVVLRRAAQQHRPGRLADLGAILQELHVGRVHVRAPHLETVLDRLDADRLAALGLGGRFLESLARHRPLVCHVFLPYFNDASRLLLSSCPERPSRMSPPGESTDSPNSPGSSCRSAP